MIDLPRVRIAHLPTPIEPLPRLSATLGGPTIWVKRDDQTGLAFGGNKTRKLEFLIAAAQANGARTLVTAGAVQSNHCRQTAAAAAKFGLGCSLVLSGSPPEKTSGNLLLDQFFGAEITYTSVEQRSFVLQQTFEELWKAGGRPYLIPYGGSNPLGAAGYTFAMQELLGQCGTEQPDWIVIASSSGGTQAGLVAGATLFGFTGKVLGISIDAHAPDLQARVAELATQTLSLFQMQQEINPSDILVNDDYLGGGYGVMGEPEAEAIQIFARQEGLLLDPVYTGRAAAGLIDLVRRGYFKAGEKVLFWHTGGSPALFAEPYNDSLLRRLRGTG